MYLGYTELGALMRCLPPETPTLCSGKQGPVLWVRKALGLGRGLVRMQGAWGGSVQLLREVRHPEDTLLSF